MSSLWRRNSQEKKDKPIFLRNGAILLEKLITSCDGKRNPIRSFSDEELKIATNNFDEHQVIKDYWNKLYKGFLQNHPVSIMHWRGNNHFMSDEDACYNNIVFPIQMSHKNILKLIGYCLDTEIPTLVFESAEKGTLEERIHGHHGPFEPLRLAHRFKIAMEIAHAVAYLHFGFKKTIVFRDIKPSNILFDEKNIAKLFDFSLSESIPDGETHIKDGQLAGTFGYVAPEYMMTSDCNEKCDVYSFGILLLELLSGKNVNKFYFSGEDDDCSLLDYVKKGIANDRLNQILDPIIIEGGECDGKEEQLQAFVRLIVECVNESPEERPTMIHVAKQLRQIYRSSA